MYLGLRHFWPVDVFPLCLLTLKDFLCEKYQSTDKGDFPLYFPPFQAMLYQHLS